MSMKREKSLKTAMALLGRAQLLLDAAQARIRESLDALRETSLPAGVRSIASARPKPRLSKSGREAISAAAVKRWARYRRAKRAAAK